MHPPRMCSVWSRTVVFALSLFGVLPVLHAQGFSLRVGEVEQPSAESFFSSTAVEGMKGGVYMGLDGLVLYDSNFFITDDYAESELTTEIAPWIAYRSDPEGKAEFSLEARYSPVAKIYLNHSGLDGVDHAAEVSAKYERSRTVVKVYANYSEVSAADRIAGGFIEGSILNYGINGSYQLAPRTSIQAGWSASMSDYTSGGRSGADVYTTEVSGLWDATARLRFGPAIRHTLTESASTGERDAIGLLLKARYRFGERITFDAFAGAELSKNSRMGGDRELGPAGGLAVEYVYNDRWAIRGEARYSTVPSPNLVNYFVNDLSVSAAVIRTFDRSSVEWGLGLSLTDYEAVGVVAGIREDDLFFNTHLAYRRKIYSDRVSLESIIRYAQNDGQKDWDQWQISTGIKIEF